MLREYFRWRKKKDFKRIENIDYSEMVKKFHSITKSGFYH